MLHDILNMIYFYNWYGKCTSITSICTFSINCQQVAYRIIKLEITKIIIFSILIYLLLINDIIIIDNL